MRSNRVEDNVRPGRGGRSALWLVLLMVGCGPTTPPNEDGGVEDGGSVEDGGVTGDGGTLTDAGTLLPDEEPPTQPVNSVEDQLRELGLNVAAIQAAPRQLDGQVVADGEYSPLGVRARLAPMELVGAGIGHDCVDTDSSTPDDPGLRVIAVELYDESVGQVQPAAECHYYELGSRTPTFGPSPDSSQSQPGSQSTRTLVTGDFNSDGLDEGITFNVRYRATPTPQWTLYSAGVTHGVTGDGTFYMPVNPRTLGATPVVDAAAVSGDFTGDGKDDVVFGMIRGTNLALIPLPQTTPGAFDERAGTGQNLRDVSGLTGTVSLTMSAGNLDLDPEQELVVLVRSLTAGPSQLVGPVGEVRYFIYDNLPAGSLSLPLLSSGTLSYTDPVTGGSRNVLVADVALGDYDGDGFAEIAYTGIGRFPAEAPCDPYTYVYTVMDDLAHGGAELTTRLLQAATPACSSASDPGIIYEVMAVSLDYDGNYTRELLANERILKMVDGELQELASVDHVIPDGQSEHFSEATVALTAAEASNDGRAEVITYSVFTGMIQMKGPGGVDRTVSFNAPGAHPLLAPFDSDVDGSTVQYLHGSHRVVLTEPIIHAVLAAPPYNPSYGQDPYAASTSYGTSTSSGSTQETSISYSVGASVGLKVGANFGVVEFSAEFKTQLDTWVDETTGTSYTTTYSDTFETTGRDAVVFTSFPYDVYDYEIVNSDVPTLVGQTMSLMLPRTPSTRIVSRKYFNDRVPDGGLRIDDRVFSHTEGDVRSYLTQQEASELEDRVRGGSYGSPLFLKSSRKTVGEGSTSTSTSIDLAQEQFHAQAVGWERTHSVSMTAGAVMGEFSVGEGEENSLTTSAGSSTTLSSTVPSITVDDTTHPDAVYSYGMFTYMHRLAPTGEGPGQVFQVVNFWVE